MYGFASPSNATAPKIGIAGTRKKQTPKLASFDEKEQKLEMSATKKELNERGKSPKIDVHQKGQVDQYHQGNDH